MVAFSSTDRYSKNPGYLTVAGVLVSSSPLSELHPIVLQRLLSLLNLGNPGALPNKFVPVSTLDSAGLFNKHLAILSYSALHTLEAFIDYHTGIRINNALIDRIGKCLRSKERKITSLSISDRGGRPKASP